MAADVSFCVVSLSARSPEGDDAAYLEWHGLDHLPEQHAIDGIRHGQRWVSTPACRAARVAGDERLAATDHVVQYLFAGPVAASVERFFALGAELRAAGRMPLRLPPVELGAYALTERVAAPRVLVSADVLAWRPCRGAYLLVEPADRATPLTALVDVPGVAGLWSYRGGAFDGRLADTSGLQLTVGYLDGDPAEVGHRLADELHPSAHPLLAAPFESVVPWDWRRALP